LPLKLKQLSQVGRALGTYCHVTIYNLAIDIVRRAINVWFQVLFVIEMKGFVVRLKQDARSAWDTSESFMTQITRRQVSVDREQFLRIEAALTVARELRL
jgi:hypothetical protein